VTAAGKNCGTDPGMRIRLIGVFEVRDAAGRDCTPRGAKARALLAMLCRTPDRRRPRRWLESKLWSDRGPEQASGSLRQALTELRRALAGSADRLASDRDSVWLGEVATDLDADPNLALTSGRDFLEGIDIVDPAFLAWLAEERARLTGRDPALMRPEPGMLARPPLVIRLGSLPEGAGTFAARELAHSVARLTAEFVHVDVYGANGDAVPADLPAEGLILNVEGAAIRDRFHIMLSLVAAATRQTVWSQRLTLAGPEDVAAGTGEVGPVIFQAAEAAMMQMPRLASEGAGGALAANARIARAAAAIFSYDAGRLREADRLLAEAEGGGAPDRVDAWRSLVRQVMYVERTEADPGRIEADSDRFARAALERTDGNPLVLALVSQTRIMVDENPEAGTVLARDSVKLSPFNAFGRWSEAAALMRHDQNEAALAVARRGIELASRTAIVHWWEALAGYASLRGGLFPDAIRHFEAAHYRAPNFRAAMRPLVFLYLDAGVPEKAQRVLRALVRAEPGFTPERLRDEDYPAVTLRRSGLMDRHLAAARRLLAEEQG
jgi:tetratricopeptide (TPR) repeat protein